MPKITIATHCWAKIYPQYAVFLRAQLTSIVKSQNKCAVDIVVCCDQTDGVTMKVVNYFASHYKNVIPMWMATNEMWKRCIGRNRITRYDKDSDLIWFADCDHIFGGQCLGDLYASWIATEMPALIYPSHVTANADRKDGDRFWKSCADGISETLFFPIEVKQTLMHCTRAIGGLQITSGAYARDNGFLNTPKWQTPPQTPFPSMQDEVAYRKEVAANGGKCVQIGELQGLFRIRHSEHGYGHKYTPDQIPV